MISKKIPLVLFIIIIFIISSFFVSADLISYYRFENDAIDETGFNDGTFTNPSYTNGKIGNAAVFSTELDGYVDLGTSSSYNSPDMTIAFWAKHELSCGGGATINRGGWGSNGWQITFRDAWMDFYYYNIEQTPDNGGQAHTDFGWDYLDHNANQWYHLILTVDSSIGEHGQAKLFVDGELIGTQDLVHDLLLVDRAMYVGSRNPSHTRWRGSLDELMFFNNSFTNQDASDMYNDQVNSKLSISDDGPKYRTHVVNFYANYTDLSDNYIDDSSCTISFNDGTYDMNLKDNLFEYNKIFNKFGNYDYSVYCWSDNNLADEKTATIDIQGVSNMLPLNESYAETSVFFSAQLNSNVGIKDVYLLGDWSGSWQREATLSYSDVLSVDATFDITIDTPGNYNWAIELFDGTNSIFSENNYSIEILSSLCKDDDNDGYGVYPLYGKLNDCQYDGHDCDDDNSEIHPNREEICNDGLDNNCAMGIDESCHGMSDFDGWRTFPIRDREEYEAGLAGGGAEQHNQGMARSLSDPDTIYLSHDCGQMWRSRDSGNTWEHPMCRGLMEFAGQSIEVDPLDSETVFIIMDSSWDFKHEEYHGIYKSTNGGDDWEHVLYVELTDHSRRYEHNLAYDITSISNGVAQRWYAAFWNDGLYKSNDGGDNWNRVTDLSSHSRIYGIQTHPSDGQSVYIASSEGLFVTHDQGLTVNQITTIPSGAVASIQINPNNGDEIYVAMDSGDLYKTIDGGLNFNVIRSGNSDHVFINPGHPEIIYHISSDSAIAVSSDSGQSWSASPQFHTKTNVTASGWGYRMRGDMTALMPNPNDADEAVGFGQAKIHKTIDRGSNFYDSSNLWTGFNCGDWGYDSIDFDRYAIFLADVGTWVTTNYGDYFERRTFPTEWYTNGYVGWYSTFTGDFQPLEGSDKLIGTGGYVFQRRLMTSDDEGVSWNLVPGEAISNRFFKFHPYDPNIIYSTKKISYDAGITFQDVDFGDVSSHEPNIYGFCKANPDIVYALGRYAQRIIRSDDKGVTWRIYADYNGAQYTGVDSFPTFAVDPIDCDKVYALDTDKDLAVFNGTEWKSLDVLDMVETDSYNYIRDVEIDPNHNNIIYAMMFASGVDFLWRSQDYGESWESISYNYPRYFANAQVSPISGELILGSCIGHWILPPPYPNNNRLYDKSYERPSCHDGLKNGQEEGVDCGGYCSLNCDGSNNEAPHAADFNQDGTIELQELNNYVQSWKGANLITLGDLIEAIKLWKEG